MYQALYRKWRPKTFDDVIGQSHITETLKRQVESGRLSHAYLFVGTRGTGKTSCAKILSRAVNCEHPVNGNPCNKCAACTGIENGTVLDVVELDAASNNGVDNVRALRDEAVYSPSSVKKRIYIVDEVHMMSNSAFNALLKILEEPPEHLMFILATTELHKVPATIVSRCQRFSFKRILPEDMKNHLLRIAEAEGIDLTPDGAELLARLSDGAVRDALSLLDQCGRDGTINSDFIISTIGIAGAAETAKLLSFIKSGDISAALETVDRFYKNGKDMAAVIDELTSLFRDMLIYKMSPASPGSLFSGMFSREAITELSKGVSPEKIMWWLSAAKAAVQDLKTFSTSRLAVEMCILKLTNPELGGDYAALSSRINDIEERLNSGNFTIGTAPEQTTPSSPTSETPVISEDDAPPWDEEPVPAGPAKAKSQRSQANRETAETQKAPPAPPPAADVNSWDSILKLAQGEIDPPIFFFLSDKAEVAAEVSGTTLTVYMGNDFTASVANTPETLEALNAAAEKVLGRQVNVKITADELAAAAPQTGEADKLDSLSKFDIIKFE